MAGSVGKNQILSIYKQLLRESQKFDSYNFRWVPMNEHIFGYPFGLFIKNIHFYSNRNYALRRIRDAFKENKSLSHLEQVNKQFKFANENLDVIKRQVNGALNLFSAWWMKKCVKWNVFDRISGGNWQNVYIGTISHWNKTTIG